MLHVKRQPYVCSPNTRPLKSFGGNADHAEGRSIEAKRLPNDLRILANRRSQAVAEHGSVAAALCCLALSSGLNNRPADGTAPITVK